MLLASVWYPLETVALTALSDLSEQRSSLPDDILERSTLSIRCFALQWWSRLRLGADTAIPEISRLAQEATFLLRTSLPCHWELFLR